MLIKRDIQEQIHPWLKKHEIIVILGGRQVGKTSLIRLLQQELAGENSFYFDLEDTFTLSRCQTADTFLHYLTLNGLDKSARNYCFLDEIQYHPDPSKFLKLLHDHHPYIKLIVTGSSSFEIRRKFRDSLVGRKITFHLHTLSFAEYLRFTESEFNHVKQSVDLSLASEQYNELRKYHLLTPKILSDFEKYMVYGGYPGIVKEREDVVQKNRLREIYNTYVQRDIKDLGKISDPLKFNKLVTFLAVQTANLFKLDDTAREVGLDHRTLSNHLFLLENTFVLTQVRPFLANLQKELTKMPKVYFLDNGLRNTMVNDFRDPSLRPDSGVLAESTCFVELLKQGTPFQKVNYWRTSDGKEIDFVLTLEDNRIVPIEVKYRSRVKPEVPNSMRFFIKKVRPEHAFVLTRATLDRVELESTTVTFMPLWML